MTTLGAKPPTTRKSSDGHVPSDLPAPRDAQPSPALGIPTSTSGRKLRTAIVGAGFIADYHMQVLGEISQVEVTAACDPSQARLQAFGDRWNVPRLVSTVEELLDVDPPDVAHILAPPALHVQLARPLLQAGVHVLLEKPMALHAAEAQELATLAEARNVWLGINHNWLHHPLFRRALHDISQRKIGPIRHVVSTNSLPLFQLSAGQHDHWMFEQPTNILFEQGVHPLSQICHLIGDVRAADAICQDPHVLRGGKEFYANWQVALEGERASAQMLLAFGSIFPDVQLRIIGQDGVINIDQLNDLYVLDRRTRFLDAGDHFVRGWRQACSAARDASRGLLGYAFSLLRIVGRRDAYYLGMKESIKEFYASVRSGPARAVSSQNGRQTIAAIEKIAARPQRGKPSATVRTPPKAALSAPAPSHVGKVVVFGASGFIGRHVVRQLADAGIPQRLFVRSIKRVADVPAGPALEIVQGDVANRSDIEQAMAGCETVVHLVAGAPANWTELERLFVDGLRSVAEASLEHGVKRFLFASSITSLYLGRRGEVITDGTPIDPKWHKRGDYARAKIMCEQLLMDMHRHRRLPAVIFRPGIVIGRGTPVQHLGIGYWPSETACVRWGRDIDNELPLVLGEDVAAAFLAATQSNTSQIAGRAFNLVGDVRLSAREYIDVLGDASQRDFRLHRQSVAGWTALELAKWAIKAAAFKPENSRLTWREVAYRTGAATFDCRGAKNAFGWRPEADKEAFIEKGLRAPVREQA